MQFIDKAVNRAFKWESVDVTIPEMLDLIQTEILEKASGKELVELKKGMQKTFVLLAGRGGTQRYYPSFYTPVRLRLEFHFLTHQLQGISLQDTVNKKEYFIPTGKAFCTKLQSGVLRRMAQYGYSEKCTEQKPRYSDRYPDKTPERQNEITFCRYCGHQELEGDAFFCRRCGKQLTEPAADILPQSVPNRVSVNRKNISSDMDSFDDFPSPKPRSSPPKKSTGRKRGRSPFLTFFAGFVIILAIALLAVVLFCLLYPDAFSSELIPIVQNGYLGQYTDMTTQELLNRCYESMGYAKGVWHEGTTNDGNDLVEVHYAAPNDAADDVRIQFRFAGKNCFQISAFADPMCDITKPSDLYRELNLRYFYAYFDKYPDARSNTTTQRAMLNRLDTIPASAVQYGAAADYQGDRSKICTLFGQQLQEFSVTQLLGAYGLIEYPQMQNFEPSETTTPTQSPKATKPQETIPTSVTVPTEPRSWTGNVLESSGGLNIRNGPGRDYAQIGRLAPNEAVTIYETMPVGTTSWGRIGINQWVCMDYIVLQNREKIESDETEEFMSAREKADVISGLYGCADIGLYFSIMPRNILLGYDGENPTAPDALYDLSISHILFSGLGNYQSVLDMHTTRITDNISNFILEFQANEGEVEYNGANIRFYINIGNHGVSYYADVYIPDYYRYDNIQITRMSFDEMEKEIASITG